MTIPDRFRPNFACLDHELQVHLMGAMLERYPEAKAMPPEVSPLEVAERLDLDHADVVMCLANDPTAVGVRAAETLVGHPFIRALPRKAATQSTRGKGSRVDASAPKEKAPRAKKQDPRVVIFVTPNPKSPGSKSHARYEEWQVGRTITECIDAGLTTGDVNWDMDHGFVRLADPNTEEAIDARNVYSGLSRADNS